MNHLKSNRGYALLLVLLLIVLFVGVAATVSTASLSHSSQEKVVDTNNQNVAVAEMGTKRYNNEIKVLANEARTKTLDEFVKNELIAYKIQFDQCQKDGQNSIACSNLEGINEFLVELNTQSIKEFKRVFNLQLDNLEDTPKEVFSDYLYVLEKPLIDNTIPPISETVYTYNYKVHGLLYKDSSSGTISERITNKTGLSTLNSQITINISDFINYDSLKDKEIIDWYDWNTFLLARPTTTQSCLSHEGLKAPYICNANGEEIESLIATLRSYPNFFEFEDKLQIINEDSSKLCRSDGNCDADFQGFKIFNTDGISINQNWNNARNGTLISQGEIIVPQNGMNLDLNIITTSLTVSNFKNFTGRVLILGSDSYDTNFIVDQADTSGDGKICINLDKITNVAIDKQISGNISVFSNSIPANDKLKPFHFVGTYEQFIRSCIPEDIQLPFPSLDNNEIDINVIYE